LSDAASLWAPIGRFTDPLLLASRGDRWMDAVLGRLRADVTIEDLQGELDGLAARLEAIHQENRDRGAEAVPLREDFVGHVRPMLLVLLGAVGFVLLIACVNVASLLLARGTTRRREIALRAALGARRGRIVRQLLTESVALSLAGGAAGLLAAFWSIDALVALSPIPLPTFVSIGVDGRVLAFTLAVCVASGIFFGVAPALSASRTDLVTTLRAGGERDGGDPGSAALRRSLVAAEIALAVVLLTGAGLMLRTMARIATLDPGFRPDGLVTMRLALPDESADDAEGAADRTVQFARTLVERVRELPSVSAASLASDTPLGTSTSATVVRLPRDPSAGIRVYRHAVSPGHFRTLGIRLLEGRDFNEADDRRSAQRLIVVSRTMAGRHWPGESALGKQLTHSRDTYTVIGVVDDVQHRTLLEPDTADPDVYLPLYQVPARAFAILARTSGAPQPVVAAIRSAVTRLDASVPVFGVSTGPELVARQTSTTRFSAVLLGAFALVALTLTIVGIYGVTAYTVSRQTRQVGIRIALGATRRDVLRLVMGGALTFIATGLAAGTLAAYALTRLLASMIYGVSATDAATFGSVLALLAGVAVLACLVPATRAMRIDPAVALRSE
jgi:predicted permease